LHYKLPSVLQAAIQKFQIISVVFWFYWCSRSCRFLSFFLYESLIVRQRVLHSSSVEIERKYLNAAKFSFIANICITSPGHWDNYDYLLIVITDFW